MVGGGRGGGRGESGLTRTPRRSCPGRLFKTTTSNSFNVPIPKGARKPPSFQWQHGGGRCTPRGANQLGFGPFRGNSHLTRWKPRAFLRKMVLQAKKKPAVGVGSVPWVSMPGGCRRSQNGRSPRDKQAKKVRGQRETKTLCSCSVEKPQSSNEI